MSIELDNLKKTLTDEVTKLKGHVTLDINLERGRSVEAVSSNNSTNNDHIERRNSRVLIVSTNCLQHVRSSGQGTMMCKLHATCHVPPGTKGQLSC